MSVKTDKATVETTYVVSRTCDRCGAETFLKSRPLGPKWMGPQEVSNCASFEMHAHDGLPVDPMFFDLRGDLCEPCLASFVEWFNNSTGTGWEKGKTWDEIKAESWAD